MPLPTELEGTSVSILGEPARILAVATNPVFGHEQINVQVPLAGPGNKGLGFGTIIVRRGRALGYADISVSPMWPHIFAVTRADFSPGPFRAGETLVVWYTGGGATTPPVPPGEPAPSSPLSTTVATPVVEIYGERATVTFSGLTPGLVAIYQLNVVVPSVPPGPATLSLAIPRFNAGGESMITSRTGISIQ